MIQDIENSQNDAAIALQTRNLSVSYDRRIALEDVNVTITARSITALIGPSGCGKTTFLRCLNRLNDVVAGATIGGNVFLNNLDIAGLDPVEVRRRVGMVFQRPNPFPKSIFENIAMGLRVNGYRGNIDEMVEYALLQAGLWHEVKDNLKQSALTLSGGQQQRLCIARTLALQPEVMLMDEPCSALDPISALKIEEMLVELRQNYTIVIVTHNLQQAARLGDFVAFFNIDRGIEKPVGHLLEFGSVTDIFTNPRHKATLTYVNTNAEELTVRR